MTTIATDGETMAADGLCTQHGTVIDRNRVKVHRLEDGRIVGGCGDTADNELVVEWLAAGAKSGEEPVISDAGSVVLVLHPCGGVDIIDRQCRPLRIPTPIAIGSGCDYAMGAMDAGASPERAVEIAAARNPNTGGKITVLGLKDERTELPPDSIVAFDVGFTPIEAGRCEQRQRA